MASASQKLAATVGWSQATWCVPAPLGRTPVRATAVDPSQSRAVRRVSTTLSASSAGAMDVLLWVSLSHSQHCHLSTSIWSQDGLYGVYAEVAQLRTWIDEKIAANGGATFCSWFSEICSVFFCWAGCYFLSLDRWKDFRQYREGQHFAFYRTQVYLGSDLWVWVSKTNYLTQNILSEMIKSQENGISLLVIFVDRQKECSASFPKIVTRSSHSRSCYQRVILPPPLTNTLSQFRSKLNMIWKAKIIVVAWQKCRIPFNVKPSLHWSWQLSAARQWECWGSIQNVVMPSALVCCVGLTFLHCAFLNVSSNVVHLRGCSNAGYNGVSV